MFFYKVLVIDLISATSLKKIKLRRVSKVATLSKVGIYLIGHWVNFGKSCLFFCMSERISLTTFYMSTRLSPSAVITEWDETIPCGIALFNKKLPPPHLSRQMVAIFSRCQVTMVLAAQKLLIVMCSLPAGFSNKFFASLYPRLRTTVRASCGRRAFYWSW